MKTINYILGVFAVAAITSCVGDLNVTPIDPNANTVDKALTDKAALNSYISGVYLGFATSGYYGPNGSASISGLDGGASQYIRGLYHLNELTTDESICGWNDQTIKNFHYMNWTTDDTFIYAFYSRVLMQVSAANEFIRQVKNLSIDETLQKRYIDEARVLRAIAYYHAIDNFGNVPFADETSVVGVNPSQMKRADLFNWLETELKAIIADGHLPDKNSTIYGHVGMGAAKFILAKLYLNAEVYTGTARWNDCADVLKDLMNDGYSLHTTSAGKYSAYQELFLADNNKCTDEIIFAVEQDGVNTQSYGVTNYLIFASTGGTMNVRQIGITSGWGGLRTTPEFVDKFTANDARNLFYSTARSQADVDAMPEKPEDDPETYSADDIQKMKDAGTYNDKVKELSEAKKAAKENIQVKDIEDIGNFKYGYGFQKFLNVASDGTTPNQVFDEKTNKYSNPSFVNTDFPMMRYADVLLMAAECQVRGASIDGLSAFNQVRSRAGIPAVSALSLDEILDERGRELYQECWRRSDLIRFGKFTSGYNWQWKGEVKEGKDVEAYRTLFPIPDSDRLSNTSLEQNPGYSGK
ncbi:MAG: RagB/SusD family nutrient uptake outer membrane protein [Bacteroidota bacterium]|jgi:hypothetical protein|nr:RagB/SusD family nutrient uptake outer membrane protein [Bacteroidota bacterium]